MNDDARPGMCSAYGCPLMATVGSEGKWFCFCHANRAHVSNDPITSVLKANMAIVDATLNIRRFGGRDEWATVRSGIAMGLRNAGRLDLLPCEKDAHGDRGQPEMIAWLGRLERELIALTSGVGEQLAIPMTVPTAHVVGPTHATQHYSEQTSRLVEQA